MRDGVSCRISPKSSGKDARLLADIVQKWFDKNEDLWLVKPLRKRYAMQNALGWPVKLRP